MSYDPPPGWQPPRQGRWPDATPQEAWPAYREDDGYQGGADRLGLNRATAAVGYGSQSGYQDAAGDPAADYAYRGYQQPSVPDPYAEIEDGYPGAAGQRHGSTGGYRAPWDGRAAERHRYSEDQSVYGTPDNREPSRNGWDGSGYFDRRDSGYAQDGYAQDGYAQDGYAQDSGYAQDGYGQGGGYAQDGYAQGGGYGSDASTGRPSAFTSYGDGFDGAQDGFDGRAGYTDTAEGYRDAGRGYLTKGTGHGPGGSGSGYGGVLDDYPDAAGYGYPNAGDYASPGDADLTRADMPHVDLERADPRLTAPDAGLDPDGFWSDQEDRREARRRGLAVGAVTGVLAAGVTVGVSAFTAAFFRPQSSSIVDLGRALVDRMPATVKMAAVNHLGNDQAILIVGTCVSVFVLALATGILARRAPALGVVAIAVFSLLGAFIVITQPQSRLTDVLPAVFGGQAGIVAFLWLVSASAPVAPHRPARERGARRAR